MDLDDPQVRIKLREAGWHQLEEGSVVIEREVLRQLILQIISPEDLDELRPLVSQDSIRFGNDEG